MKKKLVIEDCADCPNFYHEHPDWVRLCCILNRTIEFNPKAGQRCFPIPGDCPLENAEFTLTASAAAMLMSMLDGGASDDAE
jgi:hypothetical protein